MANSNANLLEQKKVFTKEKARFNSYRIGLEQQHARRFIILGHHYGGHGDVI